MLNPVPCPSDLLHHLVTAAAERDGEHVALTIGSQHLSYARLHAACQAAAAGFIALGLARAERVAIYLDKRAEFVVATFGASDYNQADAAGFIQLYGLPIAVQAKVDGKSM